MLAVLENSFLDTRTPLEKSLDTLIKERSKKKDEIKAIDKLIASLTKKEYKRLILFLSCSTFIIVNPVYVFAVADLMLKIDKLGGNILSVILRISKYITTTTMIIEVIQHLTRKAEKNEYVAMFIKFVTAIALIQISSHLFDWIADAFN